MEGIEGIEGIGGGWWFPGAAGIISEPFLTFSMILFPSGRPAGRCPVASERCLACVRFRTNVVSARTSCCCRDKELGSGCERTVSLSCASGFPCCMA